MRTVAALAAALSALAGPTMAAAEDAPIATSNGATPAGAAAQIEEFIRTSPVARAETSEPLALQDEPRKIHGQISVGVGTHGYRSVAAQAVIPVGKTGMVGVAVERSRGPALLVDPCGHPDEIAGPSACRGPIHQY